MKAPTKVVYINVAEIIKGICSVVATVATVEGTIKMINGQGPIEAIVSKLKENRK